MGFAGFTLIIGFMRRVPVDALSPDVTLIQEAAAVIRSDGVVALPTDTLYGLAVDPCHPEAVARLFEAKGRPAGRALPLVAADASQVACWIGPLSPAARRLADRFWPGPLTLLVTAPSALAPGVAAGTGRVGIRVPAHAVARALCAACGHPLTATSANLSGEPASADPGDVARALEGRIDLLLDAGRTAGGEPSTIVDASGPELRLVREGAIPWAEIAACVARG